MTALDQDLPSHLADSIELYRKAIENNPNDIELLNKLGTSLAPEEGLPFLKRALALDPYNTETRENAGSAISALSYRDVLGELYFLNLKRSCFLDNRDSATCVVFGSSHGEFGFNPNYIEGSHNLCSVSQDLRHSALMYDYAAKHTQSIRTVVVFYSVFSSGFNLLKSPSEKPKCAALKECFSLDVNYYDEQIDRIYNIVSGWTQNYHIPNSSYGFFPRGTSAYFPESYGAEKRANDHVKQTNYEGQSLHLVRMMLKAKSFGHKLVIIIPPARSDYRSYLPTDRRYIFRELYEIHEAFDIDRNYEIVNLLDDENFSDSDFGDFDHMIGDSKGAQYLASRISQCLR